MTIMCHTSRLHLRFFLYWTVSSRIRAIFRGCQSGFLFEQAIKIFRIVVPDQPRDAFDLVRRFRQQPFGVVDADPLEVIVQVFPDLLLE